MIGYRTVCVIVLRSGLFCISLQFGGQCNIAIELYGYHYMKRRQVSNSACKMFVHNYLIQY